MEEVLHCLFLEGAVTAGSISALTSPTKSIHYWSEDHFPPSTCYGDCCSGSDSKWCVSKVGNLSIREISQFCSFSATYFSRAPLRFGGPVAFTHHAGEEESHSSFKRQTQVMVRGCSKRVLVLMWIASCCSHSTDAFQAPVKTRQLSVPRILQVASVDTFTHHHQYSNSTSLFIDEKDIQPSATQYLQSSTTTTATLQPGSLNSLEQWCLQRLEAWYNMSQRVKCPFFRRRYGDALDHVEWLWRHFVVRQKFRDALGPPQSRLPVDSGFKAEHLSIPTITTILRNDWQGTRGGSRSSSNSSKGYYVTGKLSTQIYRDDCLFTSPDPDLPIHGLRKYMGVASHLFDSKTSSSELLSLNVLDDEEEDSQIRIQAMWRMHLRLRLPWKPQLPPLTGSTTYHLDESHLIHHHAETWDMDVSEAFWAVFIPHKIVQQQLDDGDALTSPSMARSTGTCPFAKLFHNNK